MELSRREYKSKAWIGLKGLEAREWLDLGGG
jgi:hypothetical protein